MNIKAYIVAGEVSGDNHGSGLMSEIINLCEGIEFYGMGGPSMANYSNRVQNWINESAVVGKSARARERSANASRRRRRGRER